MEVEYRKAMMSDIERVVCFVDFWLTGGGLADGVPGSGHDFFVPRGLHQKYFAKYEVLLALYESEIVGWAVKTNKGVLIHLLVAGTFRGNGIGSELLRRMSPEVVRSKFDQSTGDPAQFYRKHGFVRASSERLGKKKNIELFVKKDNIELSVEKPKKVVIEPKLGVVDLDLNERTKPARNIDIIAGELNLVRKYSDKYSY